MKINPKMLVSDYDQTFYLNDEDIEKNKTYLLLPLDEVI